MAQPGPTPSSIFVSASLAHILTAKDEIHSHPDNLGPALVTYQALGGSDS